MILRLLVLLWGINYFSLGDENPKDLELICECSKGNVKKVIATGTYSFNCSGYISVPGEPLCIYSKEKCKDTEVIEIYRKKDPP